MLTVEENFLSMTRAVHAVLKRHESKWKGAKRFAESAQVLENLIGQEAVTSTDAGIITTGATEDKHGAGNAAFELGADIAKRASIYAIHQKNMELHDQLRVSRSSFAARHHAAAVAKLRDIIKRLMPILLELADYGISPTEITQLTELTNRYEKLASKPRDLVVTRKTINQSIPKLIAKLRKVLYELDSLISMFKTIVPQFVEEYKNARKIINLGSRSDDSKTPPEPPKG